MFESAITESSRKPAHHLSWFLSGGVVGLAIALFFTTQFGQTVFPERVLLTLWPLGILLMAVDRATVFTIVLAIAIVYGSNFVLYGLGFLLVSLAVSFVRSFRTSRD